MEPKAREELRDYLNQTTEEAKAESVLMNLLSPFCCPICKGNGLVQEGFYRQVSGRWDSSKIEFENCRSCNGTGIVWR